MTDSSLEQLSKVVNECLADKISSSKIAHGELTIEVAATNFLAVCQTLRDEAPFKFEQLVDLCGVDYSTYGKDEWDTEEVSASGFSRGVESNSFGRLKFGDSIELEQASPRFAVVIHLISYSLNQRLRVRCFALDNQMPVVPSVTALWACADWYEREAFDLFGILFEGHNDLRRILTDYGFVGHPFRKDFPLVGHVEMRYDPAQKRVIYEPVSIEPRVLVPRVIRNDHRYLKTEDGE